MQGVRASSINNAELGDCGNGEKGRALRYGGCRYASSALTRSFTVLRAIKQRRTMSGYILAGLGDAGDRLFGTSNRRA
jgi:hypothetical protein